MSKRVVKLIVISDFVSPLPSPHQLGRVRYPRLPFRVSAVS
jgi:hypothetical protein